MYFGLMLLLAPAAQASASRLVVTEWLKGSVTSAQEQAPVSLDFEVVIDTPDLNAYLADPLHEAPVTGTITMGDAPQPLPILEGWCRFFIDSGSTGLKYMTYRMVFDHPTRGLMTLFGKKFVRNDEHGLDLWPDVTTLYTDLVPGIVPDTLSPRPAAQASGILRIRPEDLLRSMASIHTPEAGALAGLALRIQFGKFFFNELWSIYNPL